MERLQVLAVVGTRLLSYLSAPDVSIVLCVSRDMSSILGGTSSLHPVLTRSRFHASVQRFLALDGMPPGFGK